MSDELKLFDRILFGDLRPWLPENQDDEKFRLKLSPSGDFRIKGNLIKTVEELYKDNPYLADGKDHRITIGIKEGGKKEVQIFIDKDENDIFPPLINIDLPPPFDNKTEYYSAAIDSECSRLLIKFNQVLAESNDESSFSFYITKHFDRIKIQLQEGHTRLRQIGFESLSEEDKQKDPLYQQKKINDYIFTCFCHDVIRLILWIQTQYHAYIKSKTYTSEHDIYSNLLHTTPPALEYRYSSTKFLRFLLVNLITKKEYSLVRVKEEINSQKRRAYLIYDCPTIPNKELEYQESLRLNVLALENLIFVKTFEIDIPQISFDLLISQKFMKECYNDFIKKIRLNFLDIIDTGDALAILRDYESQNECYKTDPDKIFDFQIDSLPAKFHKWIKLQIEFLTPGPFLNIQSVLPKYKIIPASHVSQPEQALPKANKPKSVSRHPAFAYTYKQYNTNPDAITNLLVNLKKNDFVSAETNIKDFHKIFNDTPPKKLITWTGIISELYYFVKLLHGSGLIADLKKDIWKVTGQLFVDAGQHPFNWKKFRGQKPPAKAEILKKAIQHLS